MVCIWAFILLAIAVFPSQSEYVWNTKYTIVASVTDPNITDSQSGQNGFGPHTIFINTTSSNGVAQPLFVFLPATLVQSDGYTYMLNMAASLGWKAIGLAYNNSHDPAEADLCAGGGLFNQDCEIQYRTDTLIGGGDTSESDSIVNRLYKLLLYLHEQYPSQGWDNFYNSTTATASTAQSALVWDRMAWGGHSQGGGTSQLVGMRYPTRRVLEIATGGIITIYPATDFTPLEAFFTFTHARDTTALVVEGIIHVGPLDLLSFGPEILVDNETTFAPSHVLTTNSSATLCYSVGCHACVAFDINLVKDANGHPVFEPVWMYMLGAPIGLEMSPTPTPSQTPSIPASPSASRSPIPGSPSATPSTSPNPGGSASATPSTSPNPGGLPSATPSTSPNPGGSPSASPSTSPNPGGSASATPSVLPSATPSPFVTPSPVSVPNETPSESPSPPSQISSVGILSLDLAGVLLAIMILP